MKVLAIFSFLVLGIAHNVAAQSKKIDLASDPNKPVLVNKSNAQMLREARREPSKQNDSIANMKVDISNTVSPYSGSQVDQNGQRLNTQSTEINLGNKKANTVIQYDNSGKIQSTGTSIELGK